MTGKPLAGTLAALALLASGCDQTPTTTNTATGTNANANTVVVNANRDRDVDIDMSREDFEKQKERFEREARELGRKVGPAADDLWIWTKTRAALAGAEDLRDSTIEVDVESNVVTLTGTVPTAAAKDRAGEIASKLDGVKSVHNRLAVGASGAGPGNANR
jgi:hypothetical protein